MPSVPGGDHADGKPQKQRGVYRRILPPLQDNDVCQYRPWPVLQKPVLMTNPVRVVIGVGFLFCPEVTARGHEAAPTMSVPGVLRADPGGLLSRA